jgi:hypothetical protein
MVDLLANRVAFAEQLAETFDPMRVVRLLNQMGLRPKDLALALGVHPRTVRTWLDSPERDPSRHRDEILNLKAVVLFLLRRGLLSPPNVAGWLVEPNEQLGFQRPLAVLADDRLNDVVTASATFVRPVPHAGPTIAAGASQSSSLSSLPSVAAGTPQASEPLSIDATVSPDRASDTA